MAFTDGQRSRFHIADTGGVMRDLSAYITEVSGLPGERTLNEVTALGDLGTRFKPGADVVQFTLRGLYDDTLDAGADAVLGALRCHTAATAFEYAPAGLAVDSVRYAGDCWVRSYELLSRSGEIVSWRATLQVEGVTSRTDGA